MLNRKDLLGGVMLGTVLSCVLCVGAVTTSANAFVSGAQDAGLSHDGAHQDNAAARSDNHRASSQN